jgi:hypothetical protein
VVDTGASLDKSTIASRIRRCGRRLVRPSRYATRSGRRHNRATRWRRCAESRQPRRVILRRDRDGVEVEFVLEQGP